MKLSIIMIFYNMKREAPRTLFSASPDYQNNIENIEYEVLAIDNASKQTLPTALAESFGSNFSQVYTESEYPSPCKTINKAVKMAKGEYVMICIDGARILSPGIIHKSMTVAKLYDHPFIYTIGMHLGVKLQNLSMLEGYNQDKEDTLLSTVDWRNNGYELFNISSIAASCRKGFFSSISESNCFIMRRDDYLAMNGFNEEFKSPGGGLCNLDIFKRAHEFPGMTSINLLGEATFHQFHGGVATNVIPDEHPFQQMSHEYKNIYGESCSQHDFSPVYFGDVAAQARRFI